MTRPSDSARRRAKEIFEELVELPSAARQAELDRLALDPAVRAEVESLLRAHEEAVAFLEEPTFPPVGGAMEHGGPFEGIGSQVGPYRLIKVLGEGGFGTVFLAEQDQPVRRRVALKLIKVGMDTRQVVARFEAERQALAIMEHPNIARVFEAGATDTGRPYFVMELVEGIPITYYCDDHKLSLRRRLELFVPIVQAVQHAHTKGIIHRDIKPSNVLVALQDGKPAPKVIDFGIAKATDARLTERTLFTEQRQLVGTPEYMSPEQAGMVARDVDTRSDIYSLGVLLYELLTGTTPFDSRELRSKAFTEMQRTIREVDPPAPSTRLGALRDSLLSVAADRSTVPARLSSTIRGELDWIVMKCLEKDRTRRYQTAAALSADVLQYLSGGPVSAAAPSRMYLLRKFARRNRVSLSAAAAVLGALLIGLVLAGWGLLEARRERDDAVEARNEAEEAREAAEAARAAEAEAREYERQTDVLLRDMFESIEPVHAQGRQVLVRDILDATVKRIDEQPPSHPIVEASIRFTLGRAYANLGLVDVARSQLQRAAELYRAQGASKESSTAKTLSTLADVYQQQGQLALAEETFREAAGMHLRLSGANHVETIQTQTRLADVLALRGNVAEADAILASLLPEVRKIKGEDSDDVIGVLLTLAGLRFDQGQYSEAEKTYRQALEISQRMHGDSHPTTIIISANLGSLLRAMGRFDEAIERLTASRDAAERVFGKEHTDTLAAGNNLALLLQAVGRLDEAKSLFEDVLARRREALGEDSTATLTSRANLAFLLQAMRRYDEAEAELKAVSTARKRLLGPEHANTLLVESGLGWLRYQRGEAAEAEEMLRDVLGRARAALTAEHPVSVATAMRLGQALLTLERPEEAEPLLAEAYTSAQKLGVTATQPQYAQAYGTCLLELGRARDALPALTAAAEAFGRAPAPEVEAHRRLIEALSECHQQLGDPAAADRWRQRLNELPAPTTTPATRAGSPP